MGEGTKYITIMRDPVELFESEWGFYNYDQRYGMSLGTKSIGIYLKTNFFCRGICNST